MLNKNIDKIVAGAIFDFAGYLTTRDQDFIVGAHQHPETVLNHLLDWAKMRSLSVEDPNVLTWNCQPKVAMRLG